eukprot:TRINITY_DN115087_c0_g1_i1.p1 TRINITY_DN115087_c0_g1~~TRINITY_DN115087_c0_g1_i1.p1  ORF type:complete len:349 (+),score=39.60 TRINITY_DN115087_c0_g1_i1:38-1048(+)
MWLVCLAVAALARAEARAEACTSQGCRTPSSAEGSLLLQSGFGARETIASARDGFTEDIRAAPLTQKRDEVEMAKMLSQPSPENRPDIPGVPSMIAVDTWHSKSAEFVYVETYDNNDCSGTPVDTSAALQNSCFHAFGSGGQYICHENGEGLHTAVLMLMFKDDPNCSLRTAPEILLNITDGACIPRGDTAEKYTCGHKAAAVYFEHYGTADGCSAQPYTVGAAPLHVCQPRLRSGSQMLSCEGEGVKASQYNTSDCSGPSMELWSSKATNGSACTPATNYGWTTFVNVTSAPSCTVDTGRVGSPGRGDTGGGGKGSGKRRRKGKGRKGKGQKTNS